MPDPNAQAHKEAMIERARAAYERDLPELLKTHEGDWVAYHGDRQIGVGKTRPEVWRRCEQLGLPAGEFWAFNIQPIVGVLSLGMAGARWDSEGK